MPSRLPEPDPELFKRWTTEKPDELQRGLVVAQLCLDRWGLELIAPLRGATCSLLYEGTLDGREVVLKVPLAEEERVAAREAIGPYSKHGGIPLLQLHESSGATLMPRLRPATTLGDEFGFDDEATRVAARLMKRIHEAPAAASVSTADWVAELDLVEPCDTALDPILGEAKRLAHHLLDTTGRKVLLHGDLHQFNILRDGEDWYVVDPKGLVGDPAFEPVGFLRNPFDRFGEVDLIETQRRRILLFAEILEVPAFRVWGWGWTMNVLSSIGWGGSRGAFYDAVNEAVLAMWELRGEFGAGE